MDWSCNRFALPQNHCGLNGITPAAHIQTHPQPTPLGNATESDQSATQTRDTHASSHCLHIDTHSGALGMPAPTRDSETLYTHGSAWAPWCPPALPVRPDQGSHFLPPCFQTPPFPSVLPYPNSFLSETQSLWLLIVSHLGEIPIIMHYPCDPPGMSLSEYRNSSVRKQGLL